MKNILIIVQTELLLWLKDPLGLLVMVAAPIILTFLMASAFSASSPITDLPDVSLKFILFNKDTGSEGKLLVESLQKYCKKTGVEVVVANSEAVFEGQFDQFPNSLGVIIPEDFSLSLQPVAIGKNQMTSVKDRPLPKILTLSSGNEKLETKILLAVIKNLIHARDISSVRGQIILETRTKWGLLSAQDYDVKGNLIAKKAAEDTALQDMINLNNVVIKSDENPGFDWANYSASSMAILYLMLIVTLAVRSLKIDQEDGFWDRLLAKRKRIFHLWSGKLLASIFQGMIMVILFILFSTLFLDIKWGNPVAIFLIIFGLSISAVGWGSLLTTILPSSRLAGFIIVSFNIVFAGISGNFFPRFLYPDILKTFSYITPNAWGIEAFYEVMNQAAGISAILPALLILAAMGVVMIALSWFITYRKLQYQR